MDLEEGRGICFVVFVLVFLSFLFFVFLFFLFGGGLRDDTGHGMIVISRLGDAGSVCTSTVRPG